VQRFFGLVEGMPVEKITRSNWTKLNMVWVVFFVAVGLLNIYVAYNFSQATWVKFKVFGLMALTFAFMLAQTLWIASLIGGDKPDEIEQ
jgi:intracellular septation protein